MIAKQFTDYTLVPVTYYMYNRDNEGEYFSGLPPDYFVADDLDEAFVARRRTACRRCYII